MASFRVVQTTPSESFKQLRVEDALAYLDKVKQQFGNKPQIYNKFLEIMKSFKAQTIDTPGVIKRVSELFKGHNNLILGFNTFLPPGFKIEVVEEAPPSPPPVVTAAPAARPAAGPAPSSPTAAAGSAALSAQRKGNAAPPVRTGPNAAPLEFDHAINYVTKIKRRFSSDPQTYKSFLEILHTYQKQQRSIKEVLERVSVLFKDHPDLLRDFTYFLPDAVQESAQERITRVAENARQREVSDKAKGRGGYEPMPGRGGFDQGSAPLPSAGYSRGPTMGKDRERIRELDRESEREANARYEQDRIAARDQSERDRERGRLLDRARDRIGMGMGPGKSPRMQVMARKRREKDDEMHFTLTPSERHFFERVRSALGGRESWVECLKCLDMYASEILTRQELMVLLADIFGPQNVKLLDELKQLLNNRGVLDMTAEDVWYSMPIGEIDLSQAVRCTPSYRQLPEGYPMLACSERGKLEREVCNDHWVSVPTGSEDFSFKIMRKNQYEDALFRCEDERYEIDMVIENNMSAIRVLEPLAEEIQALKDYTSGIEWQFRLDRRSLGVLHLKAISRVYGDFGNEVLELLRKNPATAIPIILTRLKQKDAEWRRAKAELNKGWKEVMEKNYYKSLDHRSFYFKQVDKKHLHTKYLVGEMRAKVETLENAVREYLQTQQESAAETERAQGNLAVAAESLKPAAAADGMDIDEPVAAAAVKSEAAPVHIPASLKAQLKELVPEMHFIYRDISVHKDAYALLAYAIEKTAQPGDKGAIADMWRSFLLKFFQIPPDWTKNSSADVASDVPIPLGSIVKTPYGIGVVENWKAAQYGSSKSTDKSGASTLCHVMFSWGRGVLSASDVHVLDLGVSEAPAANVTGGFQTTGRVKPINAATAAAKSKEPVTEDTVMQAINNGTPALAAVEGLHSKTYVAGPPPPPESIFYCTSTGYGFFRLHQMLVDRLLTARLLCANASGKGLREFGKPQVPHPADKAAESIVNAPGMSAANQGHAHNEMRAVAAAAAGDLTAATAAGVAAGVNPGGVPAGTTHDNTAEKDEAHAREAAKQTYQHFLTALYALVDGSMDNSRYEDECRELMGTGAYLLFTLDKLISSAAKQLIVMVHDSPSVRLRSLWEYTQAKVALTRKVGGVDANAIDAVLQSYRSNVGSSIMARGNEEVYCIQYTVDTPDVAVEDIVPQTGLEEGEPHHRSASLTIRYVGKPTYDFNNASTIRGFQYAAALPAYLSRLVGQGRLIMGDETIDEVEEEAAADEVSNTAKGAKRAVPYLARTLLMQESGKLAAEASDGGATAAANRVNQYANAPAVAVTSNLAASVGEKGALRFVGGTEESIVRQ